MHFLADRCSKHKSVNGKVMGKELDVLKNAGIIMEEPGYIRNLSGFRNLEYLYRISNKKIRMQFTLLCWRRGAFSIKNFRVKKRTDHVKKQADIRLILSGIIIRKPVNGYWRRTGRHPGFVLQGTVSALLCNDLWKRRYWGIKMRTLRNIISRYMQIVTLLLVVLFLLVIFYIQLIN